MDRVTDVRVRSAFDEFVFFVNVEFGRGEPAQFLEGPGYKEGPGIGGYATNEEGEGES